MWLMGEGPWHRWPGQTGDGDASGRAGRRETGVEGDQVNQLMGSWELLMNLELRRQKWIRNKCLRWTAGGQVDT